MDFHQIMLNLVFFFLVYTCIWLSHRVTMPRLQKFFYIILHFVITLLVCYSRIHLGVHSLIQVFAGSVVGILFGLIWGTFAQISVWKTIFPIIENSFFGRKFFFKDCSFNQMGMGLHEFEYCQTQQRKKGQFSHKTGNSGDIAEVVPLPHRNGNGIHK